MTDWNAQFDVLSMESDMFGDAIKAANKAKTTSEMLSHMAVAVSHGFAIIEHIAALRAVDATQADELSEKWRTLLQDVISAQHQVFENRRTDLGGGRNRPDS